MIGERAVEMLEYGCKSSMHSDLCDKLEKRDRARPRKLYEAECKGGTTMACERSAKLPPG